MPSHATIPPPLSNYMTSLPPQGSLTLITSVLGASANWIILRHIWAALNNERLAPNESRLDAKVVFVSWLRGFDFWKDGARRLGLNLTNGGRIKFIDALQSGLGLQVDGIKGAEKLVLEAVNEAKSSSTKVMLILDGIDFLLAAVECRADDILNITWELMEPTLMVSVQHVDSTTVSISADYPLIQSQETPLELNHAAFVMSIAHQARTIWEVRPLDTGSARDVSGVVRITKGPAFEEQEEEGMVGVEEKEWLYFVARDGGVRVFERGSS
ncbi:MAG: hypothetical protein Q9170_001892 [Blastenia crenularia]